MNTLCLVLTQTHASFTRGDKMPITMGDFNWLRGHLRDVITTWQMLDAVLTLLAW